MPHTLDPAIASIASFFQQNGYVVIDPQIPDELIEETNSVLRDLFVPTYDPWYADETRVQDLWFFNEQVRQIALAPRVLEILRALYGREPLPFQTLNFRVGSQQRTHSDIIHFDSFPFGFMCGVWLAMEDVDRTNGPLHYFPVSHTLPRFDMREVRVPENAAPGYARYGFYEDFVEGVLKRESFDRAEVKLERGQALIWAANLFHGGSPILDSARTRLSQVTHYYFEGCFYYTPLLSDPAAGRLAARRVLDIRTKEVAPQFWKGRPVLNPGEWPPRLPEDPSLRQRLAEWWRS
jgi:hypothetical protein